MSLAGVALRRGRLDDARTLLEEALDLSLANRSSYSLTVSLAAFAGLVLAEGDAARAARLAGATDALRRRAGVRVWSLRRESEIVAAIRGALGTERFDGEFAIGAGLGRDAALAAARERPA